VVVDAHDPKEQHSEQLQHQPNESDGSAGAQCRRGEDVYDGGAGHKGANGLQEEREEGAGGGDGGVDAGVDARGGGGVCFGSRGRGS
jgi:hypothetical protein